MIDDRDGRILAVAHDDGHVEVIAQSPEAWLSALLDGHANRTIVWDQVFGLIDAKRLEGVRSAQDERTVRTQHNAALPTKHKIGLVVTVLFAMTLVFLFAWHLETHR